MRLVINTVTSKPVDVNLIIHQTTDMKLLNLQQEKKGEGKNALWLPTGCTVLESNS
jgi:hypothetical protein